MAIITLIIFTLLVLATFVFGTEIKGARRWVALGPFSVQPSEFLKPAFAVVAAWLFASARTGDLKHGNLMSIGAYGLIV
ncbi:MAG: FtsW/RodA/SpoVE family cell cycle protein, partial [Alphaproteobacteria bacterium]